MSSPLPNRTTHEYEFLGAIVDGLADVGGKLDAILDRLPAKPAKADAGGPVEVREPDPPTPAEPREVREPRPRNAPAKKTTSRARKS